ncbi:carbon storage regulator [Gottschalkia purinilytica]|uniref:Translational regulator CsrA n=1 Tax=Gottschalkia purinilytica TaxID=1503 RepID=A0A0L0WDV1_GOTPU|nr:carbon storage regulator CsrA [Gottschalkia purinilytica]KNF09653.1 carbon storage regulator [Gottschalkia purinilytica]
MLILTRKKGESLILNENIEINILDIKDGKIKIGINAPKDVSVYRKELYDSIQNENKNATLSKNIDLNIFNEIFKK